MSWFKRTPRAKEPVKHQPHRRYSPVAERLLKDAKKTGPEDKQNTGK
jgi:hypothetical protein